jgi:hypothetical protein
VEHGVAMSWLSGLRDLFRIVDGLMVVEQRHSAALEDLADRIARLEAREPLLIAEAKMASATAASVAATQHVGDLARRLGILEEQVRRLGQGSSRKRITDQ